MSEFRKYGTDYKMDKLVDSDNPEDRRSAAEQGYGLNILINDWHWRVRCKVAYNGYGLDKLINDEIWNVRCEVAKQGYGLDVLSYDESHYVRDRAFKYLKEHNYKSIAEWAAAEPEKIHNADPQDFKIQEDLKDFIYKIDDSPKLKIESSYDSIDEFFNDCSSSSNDLDELIICTVDTKIPLIKIQKIQKENKTEFKFIVDITDENSDRFLIQTTIKSKEQLNSKIQEIVESLKLHIEFFIYADDLESCL